VFEAIQYAITVQNDGNGTAGASATTATIGQEITLTATPNSGFRLKQWEVVSGGITIVENKFTMPASAVTVKAVFEKIQYAITVQNDGNGTASASAATATIGEEITLTATPNIGYLFKEWEVVSGAITIVSNKFTMPAGEVTVKAVFVGIQYAIVLQNDGGGTARASATTATIGEEITLTATPKPNYLFKEWEVISGDITIVNDKFTMPASEVTIKVTFSAKTGVEDPQATNPLKAWVNNGILYVSGIAEGKVWNLYTVSGALVKQGVADSDIVTISLNTQGVYIIHSERNTLKFAIQ
jgi:phosphoribosylformylglycinamidine (FGAM) synthase PurS component